MRSSSIEIPVALAGAETSLRSKVIVQIVLLVGMNMLAWLWALASFHAFPLLMGTAFLAYTFGLRHALDADHIAAIDNVTRKLMQQGQRPVAVGLFFSLGHSTIVFGLSAAIAGVSVALKDKFDSFHSVAGIIGTSVSALFLLAIAAVNTLILIAVWRTFQSVRKGKPYVEEDIDLVLARCGFIGRVFRPLFRVIGRSWQMYLVGFLFGLGFDTATEIGLLGISATQAANGLPSWSILVFPALFAAGMCLIDSLDSLLMLGTYGWAFVKPIRKIYYNITITFVSVVVALAIGGLEALGLIGDQFKMRGAFWDTIRSLNDHFGAVGLVVVAVFVASLLVSIIIYCLNRFDEIEVQTAPVRETN